ncbi:MAG: hypothetical protein MMC33_009020 [Icmadophila ericetorum]|nr:hypothetical protein [Icmadophila ericetorum]
MNSSTLRRLASDHASLHKSDLPPNYLFPPSNASIPDDLTQLIILLAGPQGTPYSAGVWKLHLKIPQDYPKSPPKASFRTKIWHPNVEESTGSICVETLKRDWQPKLTLRDVLVTISCLLIQPNPDSALNGTAGKLLQEHYESFARQAKLMTSIHAPVSSLLKEAVMRAQRRGEEESDDSTAKPQARQTLPVPPRSSSKRVETLRAPILPLLQTQAPSQAEPEVSDDEETLESSFKENDPSLSPSPVSPPPPNIPRPVLGKRPLSDLPTPSDPDAQSELAESYSGMTPSERNIAKNTPRATSTLRNSWSQIVTPPGQPLPAYNQHQQPKKLVVSRSKNSSFTFTSPSPHSLAYQSTSACASTSFSTSTSFSASATLPRPSDSHGSVPTGLAILSCDLETPSTSISTSPSTFTANEEQPEPARKRVCSQEEKSRVENAVPNGEEKENITAGSTGSAESSAEAAIMEQGILGLTRPIAGTGLLGSMGNLGRLAGGIRGSAGAGGVMANRAPNAGMGTVRRGGALGGNGGKAVGKPRIGIRRL